MPSLEENSERRAALYANLERDGIMRLDLNMDTIDAALPEYQSLPAPPIPG